MERIILRIDYDHHRSLHFSRAVLSTNFFFYIFIPKNSIGFKESCERLRNYKMAVVMRRGILFATQDTPHTCALVYLLSLIINEIIFAYNNKTISQ